ncbi:hypothetical protein LEL_07497 [Akanthomyces lecanii RCEF 1005]|uniref:Uncharacterized protein n=1 Tax=Akanthomyces lecanii RCEF 1005 TaxID=1081108 RepID=A0A162N4R2_CORDF|nr:hypothetical protein LEL_07497 [Akanthomyces lecanii RCEF 1005]
MASSASASDVLLYFDHGRVERVKLKRTYPSFLDGEDLAERNNTGGPRHVPGIHVAINFERHPNIQFSHGFGMWKQERLSSPELAMLRLMNDLTEEENWQADVFNFPAMRRWKMLALSSYFTDHELWDWCLFELMEKAKVYTSSKRIFVLDSASRVCKSDRLRDTHIFKQLITNTGKRSISPWLYPFIYAGSPIRADGRAIDLENVTSSIGGGIIPPRPFWDADHWSGEMQYYSKKSEWIAADVRFTGEGNSVKFLSPINNLHPLRHKPLYSAIENLIAESIPEWNQVLLYKSLQRNGPRIKSPDRRCNTCIGTTSGSCSCAVEFNKFSEWIQGTLGTGTEEPPENSDWSPALALNGEYANVKRLYDSVSLSQGFKDKGLQVHVELANLETGSDRSTPAEDSWRFEWGLNGNRNERIVATTLVCLRQENLKDNSGKISFRSEIKKKSRTGEAVAGRVQPSTSAPSPVSGYSLSPHFQELGSVSLPEGRVVTFPNTLQHKLRMDVQDGSKRGRLQFLAIHLVDPHYRVCSTRHVPPQSVSWWWEAARLGFLCWQHKIPLEIKMLFVDFAIGEGCGHSIQQGEEAEEPGQAPNGGSNGGSNNRICFARDNSPEQVQEEKPIRIEAAVKMRQKALDEHSAIIRALNHLRIYGVPSRLRPWYRHKSSSSIPLDHAEPEESGLIAVNSVVNGTGDLVWAPGEGEEDDVESDDEEPNGAATGGPAQNGPTQNAPTPVAQAQAIHASNSQSQNSQPQHSHVQTNLTANLQAPIPQAQNAQAQNAQDQNDRDQTSQEQTDHDDQDQSEIEDNAQKQISDQFQEKKHMTGAVRFHRQANSLSGW